MKRNEITAISFAVDPKTKKYVNMDELSEDARIRISEDLNIRGMAAAGFKPVSKSTKEG